MEFDAIGVAPAALPDSGARRGVCDKLRGALRDERIAVADELRAVFADGDDDLAALTERVRNLAGVGHRHRLRAVAITDSKCYASVGGAHRSILDRAAELVGGARLCARKLARADNGARSSQTLDDERTRQQHGCGERNDGPELPLAGWRHDDPDYLSSGLRTLLATNQVHAGCGQRRVCIFCTADSSGRLRLRRYARPVTWSTIFRFHLSALRVMYPAVKLLSRRLVGIATRC